METEDITITIEIEATTGATRSWDLEEDITRIEIFMISKVAKNLFVVVIDAKGTIGYWL